jgi:hypothetical protein
MEEVALTGDCWPGPPVAEALQTVLGEESE